MRSLRLGLLLFLCGCLPVPAADESAPARAVGGELPCRDGAFGADASYASLAETYGAANVSSEVLEDEAGTFVQTTLFGTDPTHRLFVRWTDENSLSSPASVEISGEASAWTGPLGLSLGSTIEEVERLNGGPFEILGWGWDYGGQLWDTLDGSLSRDVRGCRLFVYFGVSGGLTEEIIGDRAIMSNDPTLRAARPRVSSISYRYW